MPVIHLYYLRVCPTLAKSPLNSPPPPVSTNRHASLHMQLGLNEYADLTWEEFSKTRLGYAAKEAKQSPAVDGPSTPFRHINVEPKDSMDWRAFNAVTAVKNQGAVRGSRGATRVQVLGFRV